MFLAIEGIDGCGKSTQAKRLVEHLKRPDRVVHHLREPGGTPLGERLRDLLLAKSEVSISPFSEALLYSTARSELVRSVIEPARARGEWVVSERYFYSTLAYQGFGLGLSVPDLLALSRLATGGLLPDRVLLLDLSPKTALARIRGGFDRIEARGGDYFERVRDGFLELARQEPQRFVVIDAGLEIDAVAQSIREAVLDVAR